MSTTLATELDEAQALLQDAGISGPEGSLLDRFAHGDNLAFDELVLMHQEAGFWTAQRLVRDEDTAHDIVQDAFLRVMENRDRYDASRPFRAWFQRIVRNLAIDHLRRHRREYQDYETAPTIASSAATRIDQSELKAHIDEVLLTLPEKYHDLLIMREVQNIRADHIAQKIGVDYATTRWRIHQARKLFKKAWVERFGEDGLP